MSYNLHNNDSEISPTYSPEAYILLHIDHLTKLTHSDNLISSKDPQIIRNLKDFFPI